MKELKQQITEELSEVLGTDVAVEDIEVPEPEHGDFAYPVMKAASELGEQPRELAEEAAAELEEKCIELVETVKVAGPGYLNFYLDREELGARIIETTGDLGFEDRDEKIIVEHTSSNPNKPLHMGTLRAAVLGDTMVRVSDYKGFDVEVQNFMNDLGRQMAKVTYGYRNLYDELTDGEKQEKDDFWIGVLYSIAGEYIDEHPDEEEEVDEIIKKMEESGNEYAETKDELVEKALRGQLQTTHRANIFYDLLVFERSIVEYGLLDEAMEKIQQLDAVYEVEEGEDEGCLVIDISDYQDELGEMEKPYKILRRSNGTAVYTGKDIALTMWKFGLLDSQFKCEEFMEQPDGTTAWKTGGDREKPFGDADQVINVIGSPQSYLMDVIKYSMDALGYEEEAENFHHLDFKFVYLPGKVSYSGREGNWVGKHADAVLDKSKELALEEIQDRYDFSQEKEQEIAEKVAVAAVRYFLLKFTREKDIDFSFEKALDWEGDSGPYLLYTVARAHGIEDKTDVEANFTTYEEDVEYELLRKLSEFEQVVDESFEYQEPAKLAHYVKETAEKFNSFYHKCPVKDAGTEELKKSRMAIIEGYIEVMEQGLELLGIEPLEEM